MALPHLQNSQAGRGKWDPVHKSIFEVRFSLPKCLQDGSKFGFSQEDLELLPEHILSIQGLDAISKTPTVSSQKFMGVDRSYVQTGLDNTRVELTCKFTLNLRNDTDNIIYRIFRAWGSLGYDLNTGSRALKRDYCAEWMSIAIANRQGDVYHSIVFKDVMINGAISAIDTLEYTQGEAAELEVKFVSDWWEEQIAGPNN